MKTMPDLSPRHPVAPSPPRPYRFPRSHRLSGKLAFAAVYDEQSKESRGPLAIFSRPNGLAHPRLGLSVSRRVGNAVVRGRVKRLLREAFRFLQHDLPVGYDWVVVVRPHAPLILADYQKLMAHLTVRAHAKWQRANRPTEPGGSAAGPTL